MSRRMFRRGWTMIELAVVLSVMAIIGYFAYPQLSALIPSAATEQARDKARTLSLAKGTYRQNTRNASSTWTGTDEQKFSLLKSGVNPALKCTEATLAAYTPGGYSISLGAQVTDPVTMTKGGSNVSY